MKPERLALYGAQFPRGLAMVKKVQTVAVETVIERGRGKYLPAAAKRDRKEGELRIRIDVDCNGHQYERGDVLLNMVVDEARGDWYVVGIGQRFTVFGAQGIRDDIQYAVVRPATDGEAAPCRAASEAATKKTMAWAIREAH